MNSIIILFPKNHHFGSNVIVINSLRDFSEAFASLEQDEILLIAIPDSITRESIVDTLLKFQQEVDLFRADDGLVNEADRDIEFAVHTVNILPAPQALVDRVLDALSSARRTEDKDRMYSTDDMSDDGDLANSTDSDD